MQNAWALQVRWGWVIGLAIVVVLIAITVTLTALAIIQPLSILTFVLAVLAIVVMAMIVRLIYQLWGLVNAAYEMDRNAVVIHWGSIQYQIPMASVQSIVSGTELGSVKMKLGFRWPGYFVGMGEAENTGPILFFATKPLRSQIIIRTSSMAYGISPTDMESFLQAFRERLEMGPTQEVEERSTHPTFLDWAIWKDRLGLSVLLSSVTLLILLVGVLCWRYPYLPPDIAMRFSGSGDPLLIVPASGIFYMALLGVIFLFINGGLGLAFYRHERIATYFLWSGLLAVQGGLWAATISILLRQ